MFCQCLSCFTFLLDKIYQFIHHMMGLRLGNTHTCNWYRLLCAEKWQRYTAKSPFWIFIEFCQRTEKDNFRNIFSVRGNHLQVMYLVGRRALVRRGRILSSVCRRLSGTSGLEAEISPESVGLASVRLEHAFQQFEEDALSPPFAPGGTWPHVFAMISCNIQNDYLTLTAVIKILFRYNGCEP